MSHAPPCGRNTPRWSGERQPEPPSIARLTCGDCSGKGICVGVGPPLLASGPRFGLAVFQSPLLLKLHALSLDRLLPREVIRVVVPVSLKQLASDGLFATIVFSS